MGSYRRLTSNRLMTRRRFYAPPSAFSLATSRLTLEADEARHLKDVLRLRAGDEVYVFDGEGQEFQCSVEKIDRDSADLMIVGQVDPAKPESRLQLTLAVALLKGEKFDLVVQKVTELGATRLVPLITERADIRLRDDRDVDKRVTRWQRIALEAAKQCGRGRLPEITQPVPLDRLLQEEKAPTRLFFSERHGNRLGLNQPQPEERVIAAVGSEGGWTDREIQMAEDFGWSIVTFGGRTLRAETAAITVAVLLQHLYGDLK
jgi:16S rRNA (uracil1498-N3)-methyltransferase